MSLATLDLGDKFDLVAIYHDAPNSGTPDPTSPGVVRGPDGRLYVLTLVVPDA